MCCPFVALERLRVCVCVCVAEKVLCVYVHVVYFALRVALRCKFSKSVSVVNVVRMCFYAWVCVLLVGVCPSCLPNLLFLLAARLLHLTKCVCVCFFV